MTYAPSCLLGARAYLIGRGFPGSAVGIVGDAAHKASGGYHCGNDWLADVGRLWTDYSKRQSARDRPGSNAAMALDIGGVSRDALAELCTYLIAEARAGRLGDCREIMGPHPGGGVQFWDALGFRTGASADHDWHIHLSYHRDSEGRDKTAVFRRYYEPLTASAPAQKRRSSVILYNKVGTGLYALAGCSPGTPANWQETTDYTGLAVPWALRFGNAIELSPGTWESYKVDFLAPLKITVVTPPAPVTP
jgi:hypothetical protein